MLPTESCIVIEQLSVFVKKISKNVVENTSYNIPLYCTLVVV